MADASTFLKTTIDDYLLSLAEGITHAERQLRRTGSGAGGRGTQYLLPKVDFELRMMIDVAEDAARTQSYGTAALRPAATAYHLVMRPVSHEEAQSSSFRGEVVSTIRGSFLAVPANDGKPPPVVQSSAEWQSPVQATVSAIVASAAGERLSGAEVQFNIDPDQSAQLSAADGLGAVVLRSGTYLTRGVVATDAQGVASTVLRIDAAERVGASIVVVIDVAGRTETLVFRVQGAPATTTTTLPVTTTTTLAPATPTTTLAPATPTTTLAPATPTTTLAPVTTTTLAPVTTTTTAYKATTTTTLPGPGTPQPPPETF